MDVSAPNRTATQLALRPVAARSATQLAVALAACAVLAACGAGESTEPSTTEPADLGPTGLLALPSRGVQLATDPVELAPGGEETYCFNLNLDNDEALDVVRFQTARLPGLHHFNVFASTLERDDGWGRCPNNEELFTDARPIVDGSGNQVDYAFPEGLALRLEPRTLIIAQVHFLNAQAKAAMMQFVLNLHTEEPPHTLVDIYGFTTFDIALPPRRITDVVKECPVHDRIRMLTMSTHVHARAIRVTAEVERTTGEIEPVYETDSWADPALLRFAEPILVGGGDVVRFTCTYDNRDDFTVRYGADAADEMCFLFGYYYPKVGLIPCF
ncbi:hypothetical protein L6R52_15875 [Myxococcota bacterium]|nr:hypothetical protein [Myxococcota bacterium]